jgi:hypothetical protein
MVLPPKSKDAFQDIEGILQYRVASQKRGLLEIPVYVRNLWRLGISVLPGW